MDNVIKIEKRSAEEVACWRVDAKTLTPNTTIVISEPGITVVVKADGERRVQTKSKSTVYALFNAGKDKKFFGGNKPYKEFEIYAIDQSSEFVAEWGFGLNNPIPCKDFDFDVECEATAIGKYFYKIENYVDFVKSMPMNKGVVTRNDIRDYLRDETQSIIKSFLSNELLQNEMSVCQSKVGAISKNLVEQINKAVDAKGLTVYNLTVENIDYVKTHLVEREKLKKTKIEGKLTKVENEALRDSWDVEKKANEAIIPRMKAEAEIERAKNTPPYAKDYTEAKVVFCSNCGEKNVNATFCRKCGEKLK